MFNFDIAPIRGKSNQVAGRLSRQKFTTTESKEYRKELLSKFMQKPSLVGAISTLEPGTKLTKALISEY